MKNPVKNLLSLVIIFFSGIYCSSCENNNSNQYNNNDSNTESNQSNTTNTDNQDVIKTLKNTFYAYEKQDNFGNVKQVINFKSYNSGEFFWEWSVGGVVEAGSSDMSWEVNNDIITVEYIYKSKHGGNTYEELNLKFNKNNTNKIVANGSEEYKKISSYTQKSSTSKNSL